MKTGTTNFPNEIKDGITPVRSDRPDCAPPLISDRHAEPGNGVRDQPFDDEVRAVPRAQRKAVTDQNVFFHATAAAAGSGVARRVLDDATDRFGQKAAMAKHSSTDQAQKVTDIAVQRHGGDGMRAGESVKRLCRKSGRGASIRALRTREIPKSAARYLMRRSPDQNRNQTTRHRPEQGVLRQ